MSGLADMIIARIEGERDAAMKRAEAAEKRVAELQALVDAATHFQFGRFCNLTALEHLIGEIADASHNDEDDREEDIPAISVKDPTQ